MHQLFTPAKIGGLTTGNRFVRSATWAGMADDNGDCTPALADLCSTIARGGTGLIITGHAFVHRSGKHAPGQLGIDTDDKIRGLEILARAVHDQGGRIVVQLGYGGAYLSRSRLEQMTERDLQNLSAAYGQAAHRAERAGIDGVQIFAAHGFFLSQMLCPRYNRRTDRYGGSIENRARCLIEVLTRIRDAVGTDYPVLVKLNTHDGIDDGLSLEESLQVGEILEQGGIDAIELSGGLLNNPNLLRPSAEETVYFENEARVFKQRITVPLILVGGIRSLATAERIVEEEIADFVSLSRPLICEPDLVNRWQSGDIRDAACISCNNCVEEIKAGRGVSCVPLLPEPVVTFFPQSTQTIPAGPLLPHGTRYVISMGLQETGNGYVPAVKLHMSFPLEETENPPVFPIGTDDRERVEKAISKLLAQDP